MGNAKAMGLGLLMLVGATGCGAIARDLAKQGTKGALESIQEEKEQRTPEDQATNDAVARRNSEQVARGMLDAILNPEGSPSAPLAASPGGSRPGSPAGSGPGGLTANTPVAPGTGGSSSFSSRLATQVARGLTAELGRQLGPDGSGPLGQSLSATAGRMAGTMVEQSRNELGAVFPECGGLEGAQALRCRDAALGRLGGAFSEGIAGGLVRAFRPWLLVLSFAGGLLVGLLLFLSLSVAKLRRESTAAREDPQRQRRHA
jgi:hypothetical protein